MINGHDCGHNSILEVLSQDTFEAVIADEVVQVVSRWTMNVLDQGLRNRTICRETDRADSLRELMDGLQFRQEIRR